MSILLNNFKQDYTNFGGNQDVMFDWTAEITAPETDQILNQKLFQKILLKVVTEDTVIEALVPTTVSLLC